MDNIRKKITLAFCTVLNLCPLGAIADQDVIILLRNDNEKSLENKIESLSDPDSKDYGHFLNGSQIQRSYSPDRRTITTVTQYLKNQGLNYEVDASGLYVKAKVPEAQFKALFSRSIPQAGPVLSTTIPQELRDVVTSISHPLQSGTSQPYRENPIAPSGARHARVHPEIGAKALQSITQCNYPQTIGAYCSSLPSSGTPRGCPAGLSPGGLTPNQWASAYGLSELRKQGLSGKGERLALIEVDGFLLSDIQRYAECFDLNVPPINVTNVPSQYATQPAQATETALDLSVIVSVAPELDSIQIFNATNSSIDTLSNLANAVLAAISQPASRRPTVISMSLGACEAGFLDRTGSLLLESALKRAAAMGITVAVSSGDVGITGCRNQYNGIYYAPAIQSVNFPSSSPYVTAVGGTNLLLNTDNSINKEIVWNDWILLLTDDQVTPNLFVSTGAGGGGVSSWWRRPSYQKDLTPLFNGFDGRQIPDVSFLADNTPGYTICCNGTEFFQDGGTSASAPLFAAGIALVNQGLRMNHKRRAGPINPALYRIGFNSAKNKRVMRDIVEGDILTAWQSPYSPESSGLTVYGGSATQGFDTASGWGSLNFNELLNEMTKK